MKRSIVDTIKLIGQSWVLLAVLIVCSNVEIARAGSVNNQSVIDIMKMNPDKVYACTMFSIAFADGMYWWAMGNETPANLPIPKNVKGGADMNLYVKLIVAGMAFAKDHQTQSGASREMYKGLSRSFYEGMYNACKSARGHPSVVKGLNLPEDLITMYESIYNHVAGAMPQGNEVDLGAAQGRYYANCVSKCKTRVCVRECGKLYPQAVKGKFVEIQNQEIERPKVVRPKYESYGMWNRIQACMNNRGHYFGQCMDRNMKNVASQNDLIRQAQTCDAEVLDRFFDCAQLYPK